MRNPPDELRLARLYTAALPSSYLNADQTQLLMDRGQELYRWFRLHLPLHYCLNAAVLVFLFVADFSCLFLAPGLILDVAAPNSILRIVAAGVLVGMAHGWIGYSFALFVTHEGAAHELIFPPRGPLTSFLNKATSQLCRLGGAVPDYYAGIHPSHHSKFATEEDAEFLNFIKPGRFYRSLIPYAGWLGLTDLSVHEPPELTRSYVESLIIALTASSLFCILSARLYGAGYAVIAVFVVAPNFAFLLDRVRQFSEHNLMPLESRSGARSFGLSTWGLFLGGGPWGQPCHLMHHLIPTIPWYQQIRLHYFARRLLSAEQRAVLSADGIVQYPLLIRWLVRETTGFMANHADIANAEKPAVTAD
jgi:hypothetical protein